jgi:hypothetical protein
MPEGIQILISSFVYRLDGFCFILVGKDCRKDIAAKWQMK